MIKKVAITTSSFGESGSKPLELLENNQLSIIFNKQGRTLKHDELLGFLHGCLGVIAGTESYSKKVLEKLNGLRVISRCGTGMDNVDLEACKVLGIKVFNTPDAPTRTVAELVIGLIFNLLRKINIMDQEMHSGLWQKRLGRLFLGKEIGVVGLGRIGKEVAKLSGVLGAKVFYYDDQIQGSDSSHGIKIGLNDLLNRCDVVSLHLPFTPHTRHFIGKEQLALMKKTALLINCSRGGIVEEEALYLALKNENFAGAAIDVFESEPYSGHLRELPNVILTPHIGSYAQESRLNMELTAVDNLIRGFKEIGLN